MSHICQWKCGPIDPKTNKRIKGTSYCCICKKKYRRWGVRNIKNENENKKKIINFHEPELKDPLKIWNTLLIKFFIKHIWKYNAFTIDEYVSPERCNCCNSLKKYCKFINRPSKNDILNKRILINHLKQNFNKIIPQFINNYTDYRFYPSNETIEQRKNLYQELKYNLPKLVVLKYKLLSNKQVTFHKKINKPLYLMDKEEIVKIPSGINNEKFIMKKKKDLTRGETFRYSTYNQPKLTNFLQNDPTAIYENYVVIE